MEEKTIMHYSNSHKILLVGEGDFSFSLCLAKAFGSATNMVATSLDSEDSIRRNYSMDACRNLDYLKNLGCTIAHEVDAHTMSQHPILQNQRFDRIIFNFPHAGFSCREHDRMQIELHKKVVRGFLNNARDMVSQDGEIHITHKTAHPYCNWEIEEMAVEAGLCLVEEVPFSKLDFPGYNNVRGEGNRCSQTFPVGQSSTFKFTKVSDLLDSLDTKVSAVGM